MKYILKQEVEGKELIEEEFEEKEDEIKIVVVRNGKE